MVALKVKDEAHLKEMWQKYFWSECGSAFYEPDLDNQMTAIALIGNLEIDLPLV